MNLAKNAKRVRFWRTSRAGRERTLRAPVVELERAPRVNGRGLAAADYDNDGDVDVAVNSIGGKLILLENRGAAGTGSRSSSPASSPGAVVTASLPDGRRLVREVHAGSSYLSSEDPRVHFGLGDAPRVKELTVRFPDGSVIRQRDLRADRIVVVER